MDNLAIFSSPSRGIWYWGIIPIRAYALFILIGIFLAIIWSQRRWQVRGGNTNDIIDIAVWAVPVGIIGGRLYHILTDWKLYFGSNGLGLIAALKIQSGGLGIWGAIFLGSIATAYVCHKKNISLGRIADVLAPPILLAQAIGRFGNYFNQELYGKITKLPWGLIIYYRKNGVGEISPTLIEGKSTGVVYQIVHPTFLYEIIWNLILVILLLVIERKVVLPVSSIFALYVAGYCLGRFFLEFIRVDAATLIWGWRINIYTSAIIFVVAISYLYFLLRLAKKH